MDADEVDGHMQNQMEEEDTDVERGHADDSDESDEEENAEEVPNPAWWNHDLSSAMTVNVDMIQPGNITRIILRRVLCIRTSKP